MSYSPRLSTLSLLLVLLPTSLWANSVPLQGSVDVDARWSGGFPLTGCDGVIHGVAAAATGEIYVGGLFTACGGVATRNVARFDPATGTWSALGSGGGNGTNDRVYRLTLIGTDLYVGGKFLEVNSGAPISANRIARWDGTAWSALGSAGGNGVDSDVLALAPVGGELWVGGTFINANVGAPVTANRLARWDGAAWSAVGSGGGAGFSNGVFAIAAAGSDVYVGGSFLEANVGAPVVAEFLARWDGSAWSAAGTSGSEGVGGAVSALLWDGSSLYVGGSFQLVDVGTTGPVSASNIARWDGTSWSALGGGTNALVSGLASAGGSLYAIGAFTAANGSALPARHVARWDGTSWSAAGNDGGNGVNLPPNGVAAVDSLVYVVGTFARSNVDGAEVLTDRVAAWDGSRWRTVGPTGGFAGVVPQVHAVLVDGDTVYVGGRFDRVGGVAARNLARYDRTSGLWSSVGSGTGNGTSNTVFSLLKVGADLYVGGAFAEVNVGEPIAANRVARWDGAAWSALSSGSGEGVSGQVEALASCGGDLYVGGSFDQANVGAPIAANRIARWDGATWSAVGSGAGNGMSSSVFALACWEGELVAGGAFLSANLGAPIAANRIARWDGSSWSPFGSGAGNGVSGFVYSLLAFDDDLIVGGAFTQANVGASISANRLARWDGSSWWPYGSAGANGVDGAVHTIVASGTELYIGGEFTTADAGAPLAANRVAHWTGGGWAPLGSGVDAEVYALELLDPDELAVGGNFSFAGGKRAHRFDLYRTRGSLDVSIGGGAGSVVSSPSGINCPGACSANFGWDVPITLTAVPAPGYLLESWTGSCDGTGPCVLSLEDDAAVGATFALDPRADLALTLSDLEDPPTPGAHVVYTTTVANLAPLQGASDVVVTSNLPLGLSLVETVGCAEDPVGMPTCTLGSVGAGANASFTIEASVDPDAPGHVTHEACVAGADVDPNLGNNCDTESTQLDAIAPTVTVVATVESELAVCTTLHAEATTVAVTFSESVLATDPGDPASAVNPANYRVVAAAPGATFDTVDCFSGPGGDSVVTIDGASWDGPASTATLALNGTEPLPDGLYRLLVCGTIEDEAGNALDGGAGIGSDHLRTFRMDRGNLLADAHFDRYDPSCSLTAWTSSVPADVELAEPDVAASPLSGSAHNTSPSAPGFDLAQCVSVAPGSYRLSGTVRVDETDGIPVAVELSCELFDAVDCGGTSLGLWTGAADLVDTGSAWVGLELLVDAPVATTSALCGVVIDPGSALAADVFVDRLRFELRDLFGDGFESGDTGAWSLAVP